MLAMLFGFFASLTGVPALIAAWQSRRQGRIEQQQNDAMGLAALLKRQARADADKPDKTQLDDDLAGGTL